MEILPFQKKSMTPVEAIENVLKRIKTGQIDADKIIIIAIPGESDEYCYSAAGGLTADEMVHHLLTFTQNFFAANFIL